MTTITITDKELERWLKHYSQRAGQSPEEAAQGVLKLWRALEGLEETLLQGWSRAELRAEIQKGLDSEATPWDVDAFLDEAHARFEARKDV
jgi:hypothetical protein